MSKRGTGGWTPQKRNMGMKRDVHVNPRDGGWSVRKEGSQTATGRSVSKSTAINRAKGIASRAGGEVIVHDRGGAVVDRIAASASGRAPATGGHVGTVRNHGSRSQIVPTPPIRERKPTDIDSLYADFWPEDETADQIIATVRRWRHEGRNA